MNFLKNPISIEARSDQLLPITMCTPNASSVNSNTLTQVTWGRRFCLFIGLVSFLCALGIFTESQFYAYTIGIHGTYAHIIYYFVGVTLSSAIQVLLYTLAAAKLFLKCINGVSFSNRVGPILLCFQSVFSVLEQGFSI